jgi:hypothetical protein
VPGSYAVIVPVPGSGYRKSKGGGRLGHRPMAMTMEGKNRIMIYDPGGVMTLIRSLIEGSRPARPWCRRGAFGVSPPPQPSYRFMAVLVLRLTPPLGWF